MYISFIYIVFLCYSQFSFILILEEYSWFSIFHGIFKTFFANSWKCFDNTYTFLRSTFDVVDLLKSEVNINCYANIFLLQTFFTANIFLLQTFFKNINCRIVQSLIYKKGWRRLNNYFRENLCFHFINKIVAFLILVFYIIDISNFCTSLGDMPYSVKSKSEHWMILINVKPRQKKVFPWSSSQNLFSRKWASSWINVLSMWRYPIWRLMLIRITAFRPRMVSPKSSSV